MIRIVTTVKRFLTPLMTTHKDVNHCEMAHVDLDTSEVVSSARSMDLGDPPRTPIFAVSLGAKAASDESEAASNFQRGPDESSYVRACPDHLSCSDGPSPKTSDVPPMNVDNGENSNISVNDGHSVAN